MIKQRNKDKKTKMITLDDFFPEIEFPKEIEFLDELNKSNRKKYEEWQYKKIFSEKILGKNYVFA